MGFRDKVQVLKEAPNQIRNATIIAIVACVIAGIALMVAMGSVKNAH